MSNEIPKIPDSHKQLFDQPLVASLATIMADGQIQVNPVWCDYDDTYILVNTAKGRAKDKNMRARPQVTLLLINPESAYHWLEIRGMVEEITEEGADAHADRMAKKYLGVDTYPFRGPGEIRVIFKIKPTRIQAADMRG